MNLKTAVGIIKDPSPVVSCEGDPLNRFHDWVTARQSIMQALERHPRLLDVLLERERQIHEEGWTLEHDDLHPQGMLADAAACYATQVSIPHGVSVYWPWDNEAWKPSMDPHRNLAKAQALLLAEQERLDRAQEVGRD